MNKLFFLFVFIGFISCTPSSNSSHNQTRAQTKYAGFQLPNQVIAPQRIKSISLQSSHESGVPFLVLQSQQQLVLHFDELIDYPSTFGVRFSHFTKIWESDGLVPTQISNGRLEDLLMGAVRSDNDYPTFYQFEYSFPNDQIQFTVSGNWMIEVFDYNSGEIIFSLPFFITEQKGNVDYSFETLNELGYESRFQHQFFVNYSFPNDLQMPEFNLSTFAIQDGQFNSEKELDITDISNANNGIIRFHHNRRDLFLANYDHQRLDIRKFKENKTVRFLEERNGKAPLLQLFDDDSSFDNTSVSPMRNAPSNNRNARYGNVQFSFIPNWDALPNQQIFVTGTFNQWTLRPEFELHWSDSLERFTANPLLKQGDYAYSYQVLQDGKVLAQKAQNPMGQTERIYTILVYYKDPAQFSDRLLFLKEVITK